MGSEDVGAFTVTEIIGRGGMGEVWRGVHRQTDMPVAVKVLTPAACRTAFYYERFRAEVRAAAGLRHPGVVQLYDYGQVTAAAAAASGDRLSAGSPFLAMELLNGGALAESILDFRALRRVTLEVLDALAHAHARGVIHRDLKPANIILSQRGGRATLVDFGIALPLHEQAPEEDAPCTISGTPAYMAPEQITSDARQHGPWTDLYALGCTVWALATGTPPFVATRVTELFTKHLHEPPPPFAPRLEVPLELASWLHRMLAKDPRDRYRHATEAALGLLSLAPIDTQAEARDLPNLATIELATMLVDTHPSGGTDLHVEVSSGVEPAPVFARETGPIVAPMERRRVPLPSTWVGRDDAERLGLTDAGLGLFRMRSTRFVGRVRERDAVWAQLTRVASGLGPRVVTVAGAPGAGRTRFVRWLAERADEIGGAEVWRGRLHADGDANEGLIGMLRSSLRVQGLVRADVAASLGESPGVDPADVDALCDAIDGSRESTTPTERNALVARQVVWAAKARPVIVLLDDIHHDPSVISFARHLIDSGLYDGAAVLVLQTVSQEALARQSDLAEHLVRLPSDRHELVTIGPLAPEEHQLLVADLLRLSPHAAAVLQDHTAGNPLYTVELLGSWIERGVLAPGDGGYDFATEAPTALPGLENVWAGKIDRVLSPWSEEARASIVLAAVLGQSIGADRWAKACLHAGLAPSWSLVDAFVGAGWAQLDDGDLRWSFAHAMVRDSLIERAEREGRSADYHRAAAEALAGSDDGQDLLRRAVHLASADRPQGIEPLLFGAMAAGIDRGDVWLAARAQRLLEGLEMDGRLDEVARCDLALESARLAHHVDDAEAHRRLAKRAEALARARGDVGREASASLQHGRACLQLNELDASLEHLRRAEDLARRGAALATVAESLRSQAETLAQQGRHREALDAALQAAALNRTHGRQDHAGAAYVKAAMCASILGRTEEAMSFLDEAEPLLERAHSGRGLALLDNQRGESLRRLGRLDEAADAYRRALDRRRRLGLTSRGVEEANLALILQRGGHHLEVRASLEGVLPELRRKGQQLIACAVRSVLIPSVAALGDWRAVDDLVESVREDLGRYRDPDVAESLKAAGEHALGQGQRERAATLFALAVAQHEGLGDPERAAWVRARLDETRASNPG